MRDADDREITLDEVQAPYSIDMHCHIMPGVDDGSKGRDMSIGMMHVAYDSGIRAMICTPHNKVYLHCASMEGITRRVQWLNETAQAEGLDMTFYPGNELMFDSTLPDRIADGKVRSLADSRYVLVEFMPETPYEEIVEDLRAVQYEGVDVVLAHCERYQCLVTGKMSRTEDLLRYGILLQVNASDVEKKMFRPDTRYVNELLKEQYVSFVSTDCHRVEGERAPHMAEAKKYLERKYDPDYVDRITRRNALHLIRDEEIRL